MDKECAKSMVVKDASRIQRKEGVKILVVDSGSAHVKELGRRLAQENMDVETITVSPIVDLTFDIEEIKSEKVVPNKGPRDRWNKLKG